MQLTHTGAESSVLYARVDSSKSYESVQEDTLSYSGVRMRRGGGGGRRKIRAIATTTKQINKQINRGNE